MRLEALDCEHQEAGDECQDGNSAERVCARFCEGEAKDGYAHVEPQKNRKDEL